MPSIKVSDSKPSMSCKQGFSPWIIKAKDSPLCRAVALRQAKEATFSHSHSHRSLMR